MSKKQQFHLQRTLTWALTAALAIAPLTETFGQRSSKKATNAPIYTQFTYQGDDAIYRNNPLAEDEFYSPILQGCYPDPSITRKGGDYYMVHSSFAMFPGVPIFHSNDLVNWKQLGHVLERESQLQLEGCGISMGVYAPAIRYNPYNDTFYMITTQFSGGFGNIVVKTKDPAKGWGDPHKLNFDGIDPSLFFDEDGKAYVIHNDAPNPGKELYTGHRVIKVWEYDLVNDQVVAGSDQIIVDGGVDLAKKPIWIEAPHIYKREGRYYLMCAEGGTGGNHSEVIFVSDSPKGPFKPAPSNPILTQRHFPTNRANMVDWAGHADLTEGTDGKFYGVFLGVRPNETNRVNTGRETFILPVDWSGTFPLFENGLVPMEPKLKLPKGVENKTGKDGYLPNGNFTYTDSFKGDQFDMRWVALRGPRENIAQLTSKGLQLKPLQHHLGEQLQNATLFVRQQHATFTATTELNYTPNGVNELAGITCYQNERFNYQFGVTKVNKSYYLLLARTEAGKTTLLSSVELPDYKGAISLQVVAKGNDYSFEYAYAGNPFKNVGGVVSGDILSTNVAGGFTGSLIGLYTTLVSPLVP
ncbi:MAG: glycoside hydrolase family 43 protein [Phocaeicola sp.]